MEWTKDYSGYYVQNVKRKQCHFQSAKICPVFDKTDDGLCYVHVLYEGSPVAPTVY